MEHPRMRNTVFGEVLAEQLAERGIPDTPFRVGKLAEEAGLDGWKVLHRMADPDAEYAGPLDGLAASLELSEPEMMELAHAFAFERRAFHPCRSTAGPGGGRDV